MKNKSYSVVIRTLGNTGEKYLTLLQSIAAQTIQPEEIIVVIPHGFTLDHQLGTERVVYSDKGMITQRAVGIQEGKSDFLLVVDDDLQFAPTMVEELFAFTETHNLDCCLPMEGVPEKWGKDTIDLRYPFLVRARGALTGQLFTSRRKSKYLDVITPTAGHKVFLKSNQLDECYLCETACFQCFFINTKWAQSRHFEAAEYLQQGKLTSYAAWDDSSFFYPLALKGMRMAYALRTRYRHLDGSVGHITKTTLESKCVRYYSLGRNRTMFWYFSIWRTSNSIGKKLIAILGGIYGFTNYTLYTIAINLLPKYWKALHDLFLGYKDAIVDIKKENNHHID